MRGGGEQIESISKRLVEKERDNERERKRERIYI